MENTEAQQNGSAVLDALVTRMNLRNDAALSRKLEVSPAVISKVRHGRQPVGASLLLRMHEASGMPVKELRRLMGDTKGLFRGDR